MHAKSQTLSSTTLAREDTMVRGRFATRLHDWREIHSAAPPDSTMPAPTGAATVSTTQSTWPTEGALEQLELLDRLDALDRRDAQEREEIAEARRRAEEAAAVADAHDAADSVAVGLELLKELVVELGQEHLVEGWQPGVDDAGKRRLLLQLQAVHASINGGLPAYVRRAVQLLRDSREGKNPLEGYTPSIPAGHRLTLGSDEFAAYEALGASTKCGFVLVAGGLGERLGYSGIKLELPPELLTGTPYLELYAQHVLALQRLQRAKDPSSAALPLVIMTSEDTDAKTRELVERLGGLGLEPSQLHIVRQEKVPCLLDSDARLATAPGDRFSLLTKPHGHGDVHALLHSSGVARRLLDGGFTHLAFLQDTNALVFSGLLAALGVSVKHSLHLNSLSVPRRAGDAAGALMQLSSAATGRRVTCNVEYNQLHALLVSTVDSRGDVNDDSGYSAYPGNCNQLLVALAPYVATLERSGGVMVEFVNPKYADAARTAFKSPTRLECMMQDLPWLMPSDAPVSFTVFEPSDTYAPVKNALADAAKKAAAGQSPGGASSGEFLLYNFNAKLLRLAGAQVAAATPRTLGGVPCEVGPQLVLAPAFRPTVGEALSRLKGGAAIRISAASSLLLDGDITIESLELDGALRIVALPGARVAVRKLRVRNKGCALLELSAAHIADAATPETRKIRGYTYEVREVRDLRFETPGDHVVDEE